MSQKDSSADTNAPGRHKATQAARTAALTRWQPERNERGELVLKRPIADTNGNPGGFARALLRYTDALEQEIKELREQIRQFSDNSQVERVSELENELRVARTEIERLKPVEAQLGTLQEEYRSSVRLSTELQDAAAEKAAGQTRKIGALNRVLAVQDGFSQILGAPMQITRNDIKQDAIIREFTIGGLKFYHTVKMAYGSPDELIVTGANPNVQLQPYYVVEFKLDGMPVSQEQLHILFLASAATPEGLEANRRRLDPETFKTVYRAPQQHLGLSLATRPKLPVRNRHRPPYRNADTYFGSANYGSLDLEAQLGADPLRENLITPPAEYINGTSVLFPEHSPNCQTLKDSSDCKHPAHRPIG